ncbi:MAG: TadE/TadG family type IV pilus assembly protein [Candidatus Pristimantibacillus sp.]
MHSGIVQRLLRLVRRSDGAVTVFSVVVLASLLLFVSVLIDYARIAAVHKMTEDAARSAARSVLSAYDSMLYERYGLFGRGGTEGDLIFNQVAQANIERERSLSGPSLRFVNATMVSANSNTAKVLGTHEIFVRQILEEMKYKAPIDFTLELVSKFAPLSGTMKEAAVSVNLLENLRKLYEKREAKFIKILDHQQKAAKSFEDREIESLIPMKEEGIPGSKTILGLAQDYREYADWVLTDEALIEQGKSPKHTTEILEYELRARLLIAKLTKLSESVKKAHEKLKGDAVQELESARLLNEEMKLVAMEASHSPANIGYDRVSEHEVSDSDVMDPTPSSDLKEIQATAKELILPDDWFAAYREELEIQFSAFTSVDNKIKEFVSNLSAGMRVADPYNNSIIISAQKIWPSYEQYKGAYVINGSILDQRKELIMNSDLKKKQKEQEEKAGSLWKQARGMLSGLTTVPQLEQHLAEFQDVQGRYQDNLMFNKLEGTSEEGQPTGGTSDAHEEAEAATSLMSGLFGGMADMLEGARDSVYMGEYVLQRYSVFPPQNLRTMITSGDTNQLSQLLAFNNQETEYITYGFHHPAANIAAAYGELFGVRMAIRTMEGFAACKSAGHPLLILSCALIYGLEKTMEDMIAFTERGAAPLSKYIKVDVSYIDYLRLFMLIHGGSDNPKKLSRMIAVIEQNSGAKLSEVPTAVTGDVQASMELWFLPGVMNVAGRVGLLHGKVVGGRYEATQTIGWSY